MLNSVHDAHQIGETSAVYGTSLIQKGRKKAHFTGFCGGTSPANDYSVTTHLESKTMKKTLIAVALAAISIPTLAQQKAPEPELSVSGNFGVFSDYKYRGISQSDRGAAIQGGFDLAHKSGLYLGTWGSSVSDFANYQGSGLEVDVYGGYKTEVVGVGLDFGVLRYIYPGNENSVVDGSSGKSADTTEVYLGFSYGPVSYKYSHMVSEQWFTSQANKGSQYHDLTLALPVTEKVSVLAHYGVTRVKGNNGGLGGYRDYKVGIAYDMGDSFSLGLDYVGTSGLTDTEKTIFTGYNTATENFTGKDLWKSSAIVYLKKTF